MASQYHEHEFVVRRVHEFLAIVVEHDHRDEEADGRCERGALEPEIGYEEDIEQHIGNACVLRR